MNAKKFPTAIHAANVEPRIRLTIYPEPFSSRMRGREKRVLGEIFGLDNFGVNLTRLAPDAMTALRHAHTRQDEFVYILEGHPTLLTNTGKTPLAPGMCAGFKAGSGNAATLINETAEDVLLLEIGDRTAGDEVEYPDDDLKAMFEEGHWQFFHKDGKRYE